MAGLKWNTGKLYYSTVELGYQQPEPDGKLSAFRILLSLSLNVSLSLTGKHRNKNRNHQL
jgi:hypothetical protein